MIFKLTNKVREILRIADRDLNTFPEQSPDTIKLWYCNLFYLDRRKCLLFTQAKTLFSFLAPGVGNTEIRNFGKLFRSCASIALASEGVSEQNLQKLIDDGPDLYAKADNRSVLGSMNDHIRTCKFYLKYRGGYDNLNFTQLGRELNLAPMKYIEMDSAGRYLMGLLKSSNFGNDWTKRPLYGVLAAPRYG
jgi:hypothetical protein